MGKKPPRLPVYESICVHGIDGRLLISPDGRVLRANPRACELLGRSEAELLQLGRDDVIDLRDHRWAEAIDARRDSGCYRGVLRVRRADGSTFPVDVSNALLPGDDTAYVSFRDVTAAEGEVSRLVESRRAAAEVIDSLESFSDGYIGVDADWRITYINGRAADALDVSPDDFVGGDLWEHFPDLLGTPLEQAYREVAATGEPITMETPYGDAGHWYEGRVTRLRRGGIGIYFRDITERRALEEERQQLLASEQAARAAAEQAHVDLACQATHDELTGLLNQAGLVQQVNAYLAAWPNTPMTVLVVDLDRFKLVNDSFGHRVGNDLLTVFGQRLAELPEPADLVGRLGGDEFVMVMFDAPTSAADRMAEAVLAASREPVDVGTALLVTASVGLAAVAEPTGLDMALREADAAMYRAKAAGRDQAAWFDQQMHVESVHRAQTEYDLRQALDRNELYLDYQPAFDLRCERINHVEALVRWRHPTRGVVPPLQFIPIAEDSGLIRRLGEWVLGQAVEQATRWAHIPGLRVWINVSPQQLAQPGLPELIATHLNRVGLPAVHLGIEVTESTLADQTRLIRVLEQIRELGVAVAIDDFGTGYSSLARLSKFPVDVIKIDRSFVNDVETTRGEAVLAGIVTLAHAIGAHVIAEGVETTPQLAALSALGVDSASGYLLAKPTAPEHLPLSRTTEPTPPGGARLHPTLQNLLRELSTA
jgi:diguanylate cyclase (GGDEF)-like protein/PAS domain S-box-containing protein